MYYYSKTSRSRIIHSDDCRYHLAIAPEHLGTFQTLAEAHAAGYRLCKVCNPLVDLFHAEEEALMEICRERGLSICLRRNFISISTPRSNWRILADDNRNHTKLYHRNDFGSTQSGPVAGYHDQHVNYATIREYLGYIIDHDYYRMMHPLYPAPQPKAAPMRGTKRYRKAQAKEKRKAKKAAVWNVLNIIDSLSAQNRTRAVI